MLYRRFGRTELRMPVFSTGGMRYQQSWKDIPLSEVEEAGQRNLDATIRRSVEVGINHIETARGYGSSERQLGRILPTFPRKDLIVQTKIGPTDTAEEFRSNFMESLERLQLDHVDLLAIHGINEEVTLDQSVRPGGCLEMARRLQSEGLARHIGFSTHGPTDIIIRAIQTKAHGGFDYVNLHWYYINQRNWPAVLAARAEDMGVFIISPSDKGGMLYRPTEKFQRLTAPLHPIVFNDLFCLNAPEIHTLSLGASKPSDYDLHLEAVSLFEKRHELLLPILARLNEAMEQALGADFAHHYEEGLPRWQDTPNEINVPVIVWLWTLLKAFDMEEYGRMRYTLLGNGGHWFAGKQADGIESIDLRPFLTKSRFADRILEAVHEAHRLLKTAPKKRLSES
ncbi:aldo/keto reductase [bacterium]|nr:aldo/keto reductase [bacterium]